MNNLHNKYIYFSGKDFVAETASDEALGANGYLTPTQMLSIMKKGAYRPSVEDILNGFRKQLNGKAKNEEKGISGNWYSWGLEHDNVYPNALIKGVTYPTAGNVGQNRSMFKICVDKPVFHQKMIARVNSERQLYFLSDAVPETSGGGYIYDVMLVGGEDSDFLPSADYDGIASRIVAFTTAYEKGSYGKELWYTAGHSKFHVPLQIIRHGFAIDGSSMASEKIVWAVDPKTKQKAWWSVEWEKELTKFEQMINNAILFQKGSARPDKTTTVYTPEGKPVYTFDGIYEQVSKANFYSVPRFTLDALNDLVMTIVRNTSEAGIYDLQFLVLCGRMAFAKIQKALSAEANAFPVSSPVEYFIRKTNYQGQYGIKPENNLEIGWTYTAYSYMGCTFNFVHCPYFDSHILNPGIDATTGYPTKSNEMLILTMNDFDEEYANVCNLYKSGNGVSRKSIMTFEDGMHSLNTPGNNKRVASSSYDGAKANLLSERGVVVHYPHTCGILSVQESNI